MRLIPICYAVLASLALAACAEPALAPPEASLDNIQAIRAANLAPMSVGDFAPAAGRPTEMDKSIAVRAGTQAAPEGSYAKYLGDTLSAELKGAGKLDPSSTLIVSGVVTETHVDSAMPTATAALGAKFTLVQGGKVVFEKTLRVDASWSSDFMGAVAIPDAFNHYSGLFPKLANALFADPDFQAAAKPR
ncbi:MAG: hypothetical protein ACHP7N_07770 [Caulobacterales bacterium]